MRFWIFVGMLLGTMNLWGQQAFDARAAGMAFSNGAAARGLEQVGLNPAVLGLKTSLILKSTSSLPTSVLPITALKKASMTATLHPEMC